jgi:hypothetical protein
MKKNPVRIAALLLAFCWFVSACKKSSNSSTIVTSLSFEATSTTSTVLHFPDVTAAVQEVDTLHTTVIFAQYSDTSTLGGNITIHVIGDTTATFTGNNILATYVDSQGNSYNSSGDSTDIVTITRFSKADEGAVTGSFSLTVTGTAGTLMLTGGQFVASFLN